MNVQPIVTNRHNDTSTVPLHRPQMMVHHPQGIGHYPHVVLQWNCRSAKDKKHELIYLINTHEPSIIALSETWFKPGSVFKIKGYSCLRQDRDDGYAGVALLIKNSFVHNIISLSSYNDFNIVAAIVNNLCFVSIYIHSPSFSVFQELSNILSNLPKPLLLLGDFNSHHWSFGSSKVDTNGICLLDLINDHNLCLLNTGSPTKRTNPNHHVSSVDLSIVSPCLASLLSWKTLSSTYDSDHFPIVITFPHKKSQTLPPQPKMKYRIIENNWPKYKTYVEENIQNLPNVSNNSTECSSSLSTLLLKAADTTFPLKNASSGKIPSPPWWDSECTQSIKKRKEAELTYKENMTEDNFNNLLKIITETKKFLKEKRFSKFRIFCTSLSPRTPPSVMWKNVRNFRLGVSHNSFKSIPPSLVNSYLDHLAPSFVPEEVTNISSLSYESDDPCLYQPFDLVELKGVLSYVKDSAPGADGIPYSFFVNLGENGLHYVLELINSVVMTGDIPGPWKSQIVLPILKPSKDPSDILSYRPIALSPVISKIAEHLVKNRLEWYLESNNCLSGSQYGFRKGRSTMDSIGILTSDIRLAFSKNESVLATFLDIKSAYDNVCLKILEHKLHTLHVPPLFTRFIINYMTGRIINIDGSCRQLWRGLPQGSVLSPILYNVYTYDLEFSLCGTSHILQYADDVVLYCINKSVDAATSSLSNAIVLLKMWLDKNGLDLSVAKSTAVLFSRMRMPPPVILKYDGKIIPVKSEVKFLGLVLDSKLTGKPHCEHIVANCDRTLNILRCLSGVWWGAHPFTLKLVYNALIRSVLDYGSFLLEPCNLEAMKKLDTIQAKALRIITGAMKSSPINALQVECVDPPLYLRRQFLADRFFYRILHYSNHPLISKLQQLSDEIDTSNYWAHKELPHLIITLRSHRTLTAPTHRSPKLPIFETDFKALTISPKVCLNTGIAKGDPNANSVFKHYINTRWRDYHHIYCDASKHSAFDCVGIGVFHSQYKIVEKIKFPPQTSIFTAECFGLYKALEYVHIMKLSKTVIFSDSMSALQAILRYPFKRNCFSPVTLMIREMLLKCLNRGLSVTFAWIPSHSGISGNEKADRLANEAVECGDACPFMNFTEDLATLPKLFLKNHWTQAWLISTRYTGQYYNSIQPDIPVRPWFFKSRFTKRATSVLIRLRLGHMCSPAHLARLRIIDDDKCECGEVGDANHIFLNCPLLDYSILYSGLTSLKIPFPTCLKSLLYCVNNKIPVYNLLASFIDSNNIKL